MATGNQVLPGAPVSAEHVTAAGRGVTAEQAIRGERYLAAGMPMASRAMTAGQAAAAGQAATNGQALPRLRRGAGGRWLVWAARAVVWAVLLLIGYRGVAAIVTGSSLPGAVSATSAGNPDRGFPTALAQAYALEFGQVYLSFSPATAARRASDLAAFVPPGVDPELGWDGVGAQTLQFEQVAGVDVRSAHTAVVTLLARVSGHLIELEVPIYSAGGGLVVSGQPAFVAPPAQVPPPPPLPVIADPAATRALSRLLPPFFRAYASGSARSLRTYAIGGAGVPGLGGAVAFGGITRMSVPTAKGPTRHIVVTVTWRTVIPAAVLRQPAVATMPAEVDMTYALTVVRRGARWYVRSIGAAVAQPWPPS